MERKDERDRRLIDKVNAGDWLDPSEQLHFDAITPNSGTINRHLYPNSSTSYQDTPSNSDPDSSHTYFKHVHTSITFFALSCTSFL